MGTASFYVFSAKSLFLFQECLNVKNLCSSPRGRYCPLLQTTTLQLAGDTSARSWWPGRISGNTFLFCSSERSQRNRFLMINVKEFCHSLHHFAERTALRKKNPFQKITLAFFQQQHVKGSQVCVNVLLLSWAGALSGTGFLLQPRLIGVGALQDSLGPCRCSSSTLLFSAPDFITPLKVRFSRCASWHTALGCALFGGGVSSQSLFQRGRFGAAHADLREARGVRRQVLLQHGCPGTPPSLPLLRSSTNWRRA